MGCLSRLHSAQFVSPLWLSAIVYRLRLPGVWNFTECIGFLLLYFSMGRTHLYVELSWKFSKITERMMPYSAEGTHDQIRIRAGMCVPVL